MGLKTTGGIKMKIMINTNRNGYDTEQCGKTLTVGELIELLSDYDSDTPIYLKHDGGYSYGSITSYDLEEAGDDEMKIYYKLCAVGAELIKQYIFPPLHNQTDKPTLQKLVYFLIGKKLKFLLTFFHLLLFLLLSSTTKNINIDVLY